MYTLPPRAQFASSVGNGLFNSASLDLPFAKTKSLVDATTGTTLVDHTRASSGTYVGSDGLIKTATTNLILQSEDFSTSWNPTNLLAFGSGSIVDATTAPDGTLTADLITEDTTVSALHRINQGGLTAQAGSNTVSVYAKRANGTRNIEINANALTGARAVFNLGNGTVGEVSFGSASIQAVGDGWYRCSVTGTSVGTTSTLFLQLCTDATAASNTYTGDGTSGIYIWGAQLEQSSTVGEYVKTTSTINSAPRFDHDPTTGESLGLLVEESRTNVLTYSEDFSSANPMQLTFRGNVTANQTTSPDGTATADSFLETSETGNHIVQIGGFSFVSGTTYTYSVFLKPNGRNAGIRVRAANTTTFAIEAFFDLTGPGSVASTVEGTATIKAFANGWYRCSLTGTSGASAATALQHFSSSAEGDITKGIYLWGAQLEAGSFPTSYIPTTTSAVTRAADVASISGSNFSSWYRQDEGTVFVESERPDASRLNTVVASITDGTGANRVEVRSSSATNDNARCEIIALGSNQFSNPSLSSNTAFKKIALAYAVNNVNAAANGNAGVTDTAASIPVVSQLYFGNDVFGTDYRPGHIKRLTYWPTRLPNETLQGITQ